MKIYKQIGIIFLMTVVGAFVVTIIAGESASGRFVLWEFLGKPPGRVTGIIAPGIVITDSGEFYKHNYKKICLLGCWDKVESVTPSEYSYDVPINACADIMPNLSYFRQTKLICRLEFASSLMVFGIGIDGFVYFWHFQSGEPILILYSPFLGAAFGFSTGLLAILLRQPSTWRDNTVVPSK